MFSYNKFVEKKLMQLAIGLAVRFFCIRKKSVGTQNDEIREKYWFFV
jgi:hypothetical protein